MLWPTHDQVVLSARGIVQGYWLGSSMIIYKWQCACAMWIETESEAQMEKAKTRHFKWHVKRGDVNE